MDLSRNIVIEASAGTGKTYTLVHTILQALFEKNLPMEALVAVTFTKKAAGEMKERIAHELQLIDQATTLAEGWKDWGLSLTELKVRARPALESIDRAAIGTIHSFAFSLLKRFPLAAGITPAAEVDEKGVLADDLFEKEWPAWLKHELRSQPLDLRDERQKTWVKVLEEIPLKDVRTLARQLCEFNIPLEALPLAGPEDPTVLIDITTLLKPFAQSFRAKLLAQGYLSNDSLLVLARELVHRDARVRELLKNDIRLIFVDEFQDTDPLQGELLLFLAEVPGTIAREWSAIQLEPGKLFIVGDPKQSIYRFRGADISAYRRITQMVLAQGGLRHSLDQSYRSQEQIVHAVNAAFSTLMIEKDPISPAYQVLNPRRAKDKPEHQDVEIRLAISPDEPQSSDEAVTQEAEDAARWIANRPEGILYKDIALVFRSTPSMPSFVEALRRRQIPFVVEAERFFYRTPEVTDVLNLLRIIQDPANRIALAGFLRSPMGGFTDYELALLQEKNGLRLDLALPPDLNAPAHHSAWVLLQKLSARSLREPLKQILNDVYNETFLLELAARSYHQDQTIANLLKLKRLMETFAEEGETTLSGLLEKVDRFMEEDRLEGEYPLADETYDAVRLLTVHKAKGLEFPVVWLPGLHKGRNHRPGDRVRVRFDWATGKIGLTLNKDLKSADFDLLEEDVKAREKAEELRVMYVAMTRPRERLILSGGIHLKRSSKDSSLHLIAGAWKLPLDDPKAGIYPAGATRVTLSLITPEPRGSVTASSDTSAWLKTIDPKAFVKTWELLRAERSEIMSTPLTVTPTSLPRTGKPVSRARAPGMAPAAPPAWVGTLTHRFLETWDFNREKCEMPARLRTVANAFFAEEGVLKVPFPDPKSAEAPLENPAECTAAVDETQRLLADFIGSESYEEIRRSTILGREIPFFFPIDTASGRLMRGTMDILYRTPSGEIIVGDYKTDREVDPDRYKPQGAAYTEAVSRSLGESAQFRLIYLRPQFTSA